MNFAVLVLVGWGAGLAVAFLGVWLVSGFQEAIRFVQTAAVPSLVGFSLITVLLYVPVLLLLRRARAHISRATGAVVCAVLGFVVVALVAAAYDGARWWVISYEKTFMFLILALPGAVFGWRWAQFYGTMRT